MNKPIDTADFLVNDYEDIDFEELEKRALSYPKCNDPAFQMFIEHMEDESDDHMKSYFNLFILDLIINGHMEVIFNDAGDDILFIKPQHN